jgi:hypothetical protein
MLSRFKKTPVFQANFSKITFFSALEQEQQNYLNLVETNAQDLIPLGKLPNGDGANADGDSDQDSAASDGKQTI